MINIIKIITFILVLLCSHASYATDLIEGIGEDGSTVLIPAEVQPPSQHIIDQLRDRRDRAAILKKRVQETPTSRLFGAALMQNRLVGAVVEDVTQDVSDFSRVAREDGIMSALFDPPELDAEFDLKDSLQQSGLSEDQWGSFSTIYTKRDFDRKLDSINKENYRRELLNNAGLRGFFVETAVKLLDPINWLVIITLLVIALKNNTPIALVIIKLGAFISLLEGISEVWLHVIQETRTIDIEKSFFNIAFVTFYAVFLAAACMAITKKSRKKEL